MSLEAGEFAIQSGTGGGREAELPPTNLEGLPRTLAPSLDLSSPSPVLRLLSFSRVASPLLLPHASSPPNFFLLLFVSMLLLFLSSVLFFLPPACLNYGSRFYVYKTRRARFDEKTTLRRSTLSFLETLTLLRVDAYLNSGVAD